MDRVSPSRHVVIAIDGPAGAGKSTIARRLADRLGFTYIDTGAMYRAVALRAQREGLRTDDAARMQEIARAARIELTPAGGVLLDGKDVTADIRTPEVAQGASQVAVIPGVRRAMVEKQRAMGARASVVMEGRDIGSVVFPDAEVKVFLDADAGARVRRRFLEDAQKGKPVNQDELAAQMRERDRRDTSRTDAPLTRAPGAVYLDSTSLTVDQVEEAILQLVRARISNGEESL